MDWESARINAEIGWMRIRSWVKQAVALVGIALIAVGVTNILYNTLKFTYMEKYLQPVIVHLPEMSNAIGFGVACVGAFVAWKA